MNSQQNCKKIFAIWHKNNPQPRTELNYTNNFELLIAVILSAQSKDTQVNIVTDILFKLAPSPLDMINLGEKGLINIIKSLGLFTTKAKNILQTCKILETEYSGSVPNNRQALESLPGVGRKTANVVLNTAFAKPVIAVDTHILRVSKRLGFSQHTTPKKVELDLMQIIPTTYHLYAHHHLILHGRYICKAKPLCAKCTIIKFCPNKDKVL